MNRRIFFDTVVKARVIAPAILNGMKLDDAVPGNTILKVVVK